LLAARIVAIQKSPADLVDLVDIDDAALGALDNDLQRIHDAGLFESFAQWVATLPRRRIPSASGRKTRTTDEAVLDVRAG
jgi:hypothetical protein